MPFIPLQSQYQIIQWHNLNNLNFIFIFLSIDFFLEVKKYVYRLIRYQSLTTMTKRSLSSNGVKEMTAINSVPNDRCNEDTVGDEEAHYEDSDDEHLKPINGENNAKKDEVRVTMKRQSVILRRGDTDLSIDHGGVQRFLPTFMHFTFADREAEQLYREYYENEKRSDFKTLIVIVLIVNVVLFILYSLSFTSQRLPQMGVLFLTFALTLMALILCLQRSRNVVSSKLWTLIPYIVWFVQMAQIFCDLWIYSVPRMPSDSVAWILLYTYSIYVIFPLRLQICGTLAILMAFIHLLFVTIHPNTQYMFVNQVSIFH
jgi:hypothetical protein